MKVSLVPSVITGIWPAFICMLKDYSENTYLLFIYCMCIYICIFNSGLVVFVCAPINLVYIHFACFCHNSQQECTSILGMINKTNPRYIYFLIHVSRVSLFLFVFCRTSQQQHPIMVHLGSTSPRVPSPWCFLGFGWLIFLVLHEITKSGPSARP